MKKIILFLLCLIPVAAYAQFDNQFYMPEKEWKTNNLPAYEEIWMVNGSDSVHAVWCKPAGEIRAVVFFCHGNYGNISHNDMIIRPLIEDGYAVLAWDYPGFGHSTGTPTHVGIAATGQNMFDKLLERKDVQGKRVIVFGFSIGCQPAAKLARDNRERVSALVLDAGMKSFKDMALHFAPVEARPMIKEYFTSPYSSIEDVRHLEGVPILILHSREDQIAPFTQSEEVYESASEPKFFMEYPGGHLCGLTAAKDETLRMFGELIR